MSITLFVLFFFLFLLPFTLLLKVSYYNNAPLKDVITFDNFNPFSDRYKVSDLTHFIGTTLFIGAILGVTIAICCWQVKLYAAYRLAITVTMLMGMTVGYLIALGLVIDPRGWRQNAPLFRFCLIWSSTMVILFCIRHFEVISMWEVVAFWKMVFAPVWEYISITSSGVMCASAAMIMVPMTQDDHDRYMASKGDECATYRMELDSLKSEYLQWEESIDTLKAECAELEHKLEELQQAKQQAELEEMMDSGQERGLESYAVEVKARNAKDQAQIDSELFEQAMRDLGGVFTNV